jgi:hypothetical protein
MQHGGKREGAGRKPGQLEQKTIEKIHVKKAFDRRVMRHADELFNAQFSLAVGSTYIYRVEETTGANGKIKREHILVTNPQEIKEVLDENEGMSGKVGDNYFIVTTAAPDNRAIDSLLDRTFGKAQQSVEIKDEREDGEDIRIMLAIGSVKDMIELYGLSFEAAVTQYFGVVMPEDKDIEPIVTQRLESELIQ